MMKRWLLTGLCLIALSACGSGEQANYYAYPETDVGGYQPADIWTISVTGNGYPQDKIERMAMWRAARVTLDRGADRFMIIDGPGFSSELDYVGTAPGARMVTIQGMGPDTVVTTAPLAPAMRKYVTRSGGQFRIKIFRAELAPPGSYDARQIMAAYGAEFGQ